MKERKLPIHWRSVLLGIGTGMLTMVCTAAAAAGMMAKGALNGEYFGIVASFTLVGAALMGSLASQFGGGGLWDGALTALGEMVVLLGLNGALNGGRVEGFAVTALALAGGCGAGLLLTLGRGCRRPARKRKNRYSAQKRRR